jgi:Xaa-Pro aminopeptidase
MNGGPVIRRTALAALLLPGLLAAQSRQEYASRRMMLETRLPPDGVLVALGAQEPPQDYLSFYQSPSFYYLTGFREPDAALLMIKKGGQIVSSLMFVRPRQPSREVWTGTRLGTEGIETATGIRGRNANDLWPVLDSLAKTGLPFQFIGDLGPHDADDDESPTRMTRTPDEQLVERLQRKHPTVKVTIANDEVERLRGTKSAGELGLIRQAVDITVLAQKEAMAAVKEVRNEFELQALIEYTFRRNGADRPSFSSIVGSGPNSTTLHYNVDDRFIDANDLIVMDIGASYKGYAADVTRTVPASGHFSLAQRDIYTLVRDAQSSAERQLKLGAPARLMNDSANAVLAAGLAKFRLIESPDATYDCSTGPSPRQCPQYRMYYMHGLGHGIGLEVHDPDQYSYTAKLEPGSVFTLEPGIYVREHVLEEMPNTPRNRDIANRLRNAVSIYKNVGVRIEDDYAITDKGVEWLSRAPREIAEVEAQMKAPISVPAKRDGALVEKYRVQ